MSANSSRATAWQLVEDGNVSADDMLNACLKYMTHEEIKNMLRVNEISEAHFKTFDEWME